MTDIDETVLPGFPLRRTSPDVIPPAYQTMRGRAIGRARLPTGQVIWIISGYEFARTVLSDRRFSANKTRPDFPRLSDRAPHKLKHFAPYLVNLDGAEHARARRAVNADFSARRVAELRPRIQQIVDEVVDEIVRAPDRPLDLVPSLSYATALRLQELLLGIPAAELAQIRQNTYALLVDSNTEPAEQAAAAQLHRHLDDVLARKETQLGDDLISRQITSHREQYGQVRRFELASLVQLLAVGNYNSVATMISLGVLSLLRNPAESDLLLREPERMTGAVSEILRYYSINDATPLRVAVEDVLVGDTLIRAGDGVAVPLLLANRDDKVCPHADRLDLLREGAGSRHIAFGYGPHQCLAYLLAPVQLEIVYRTLFRRIPALKLAVGDEELSYSYHSPQAFGPVELPVTW
jgi:cytochrome P450